MLNHVKPLSSGESLAVQRRTSAAAAMASSSLACCEGPTRHEGRGKSKLYTLWLFNIAMENPHF